jgi:hypothetical protein
VARRLAIQHEIMQVQGMAVAVGSLFKADLLKQFTTELQAQAQRLESPTASPTPQAAQSVMKEFSKLLDPVAGGMKRR